jgi:asparagine synthase (glutamine-hydrolysing)
MSSIYGYTGSSDAQVAMSNVLRHWQPDRENFIQNDKVTLGTLELFKTPECPLVSSPYTYKDFIVIADCRIDNREELSSDLGINDISKHSDIEFIARAYEKYGEQAPLKLEGDFAFVIWDEKQQQVFAARDYFGVRTLFYSEVHGELVFASEMKGILAYPNYKKEFNEAYIISQFSALQISREETFYKNISSLEAGHSLVYKDKTLSVKKYWQLGDRLVAVPNTVAEQEAEFNRLATESVRKRLRSYGALAAEVSGGLDSTGIGAVAMEILGKGYPFYSFCYAKPSKKIDGKEQKDDTHVVREFCAKYEIEKYFTAVNELDLPPDDLIDIVTNILDDIESNGVPLFSTSFLPKAQQNNINVMLSGWAGDQVVTNTCAGFPEPLAHEKRYVDLWKDVRRRHSFLKTVPRFFVYVVKCFNSKGFYNKNLRKQQKAISESALKKEYIQKYKLDQLPGLRYELKSCTDIKDYHRKNLTHYGIQKRTSDHVLIGKHFKIDYRFPMLDLRLVEYIYNLPFETIAPKGRTRYLYKKFVSNLVPKELLRVHKSKVPTTPFAFAYMKEYSPYLRDKFFSMNNDVFNQYLDLSKLESKKDQDFDKMQHKEYLKMIFFTKKMAR